MNTEKAKDICPVTQLAPLPYPAPQEGKPGAAFYRKDNTIGHYTKDGRKLGAAPGERGPRKAHYSLPLATFNNNKLKALIQPIGEGMTDAEKSAVRVNNASLLLGLLSDVVIEFGGHEAHTLESEWDGEELENAARKAGAKTIKEICAFAARHPSKVVEVPAAAPEKASFAAIAAKNPNGTLPIPPAMVSRLSQQLAEKITDAVRLVSVENE